MSVASFDGSLIGRSAAMAPVRHVMGRAAAVHAPVLLEGETGTGKSLVARLIHERGARKEGPFVAVNCAAVARGVFESSFFGHRRGAFTGAVEDRPGLVESADGGTLFLDEVAELSPSHQAALLTVLEDGCVRRVGEVRTRRAEPRLVAATARDLGAAVTEGSFRSDLYHRLALLRIRIPPLRERGGDVELLARRLLRVLARRYGLGSLTLAPDAVAFLREYRWPGNVRELSHALEAAVILAGETRLGREHLEGVVVGRSAPAAAAGAPGPSGARGSGPPVGGDPGGPTGSTGSTGAAGATGSSGSNGSGGPSRRYSFHGSDEEEREHVLTVLARHRGNRTRAARALGMSRSTLRGRLRRWGVG